MSAAAEEAMEVAGEIRRSQCPARKRMACAFEAGHHDDHYNALDGRWQQEVPADVEQAKLYAHIERVRALLGRISYPETTWRVGVMGDGAFLQLTYMEQDVDAPPAVGNVGAYSAPAPRVPQHGRKWHVSQHATDSEIFQTALKAALTSAEHRVREHFLVDGLRVFGPHLDIEAMLMFVRQFAPKVRP